MGFYVICTSARTGGNLLCSSLGQTRMLGKPGSYLCAYPLHEVLNKLNRSEFEEYLRNVPERLHQEQNNATSRSNDLGWLYETNLLEDLECPIERLRFFYDHLKAPSMREYLINIRHSVLGGENWGIKVLASDSDGFGFDFFIRKLKEGQTNGNSKCNGQLFQEMGDVKYIWLTRRNKVRQGLSRWKAMHTKKWHQKQKIVVHDKADKELPSIEELNKYVVQLTLDDAYWEEFFTKNRISPLTVVYEDFVSNPDGTIKNALNYLGIEPCNRSYFNGFSEYKMANGNSNGFLNNYYSNSSIWQGLI